MGKRIAITECSMVCGQTRSVTVNLCCSRTTDVPNVYNYMCKVLSLWFQHPLLCHFQHPLLCIVQHPLLCQISSLSIKLYWWMWRHPMGRWDYLMKTDSRTAKYSRQSLSHYTAYCTWWCECGWHTGRPSHRQMSLSASHTVYGEHNMPHLSPFGQQNASPEWDWHL